MSSGKSRDSIRIPGLKSTQDALIALGVSTRDLSDASFKAGNVTAQAIRGLMTPYKRTGKLLSTVKALKGYRSVVVKAGNNTTAKYAGLQNFGSNRKNVEGRYFFQMGIRRTRDIGLSIYIDELEKLVKKYERKNNSGQS